MAVESATYSASNMLSDISVCSLDCHITGVLLIMIVNPVLLQTQSGWCLSSTDHRPAKSALI